MVSNIGDLQHRREGLPRSKHFNFLRLPRELRESVYKLCLCFDFDLNICASPTTDSYDGKVFSDDYYGYLIGVESIKLRHYPRQYARETIELQRNSQLLRVSKQLHAEATLFLYSNRFTFISWKDFYLFYAICGPENSRSLKEITIPLPLPVNRDQPMGTASKSEESPNKWTIVGLANLSRSPKLRNLTFTVPDDLTTRDLRVAGHLRQIPDSCNVSIESRLQLCTYPFPFTCMELRLCGLAQSVEDLFACKRWDLIETFPKRKKVVHDQSDDEESQETVL
ncbi:hypothetical protein MMC30_005870 [Trapelia coarctata]|nr:hypothetical protein [Trapelia coarctata]